MNNKVYVGMSGGVDSSVSAYLLQKQGYDVTGITMSLHDYSLTDEASDAKAVCDMLGIKHIVLDLKDAFKNTVIKDFIEEYKRGNTPNPCIVCNRFLKWQGILDKIDELGGGYLATGHYAQIVKTENDRYAIRCPKDNSKDQSYVLYRLTQGQLKRTIMPLSGYKKEQVREIAADIGLKVADKKDSQDICFIPDGDYKSFLKKNTSLDNMPSGEFVSTDGKVLGEHNGLYNYTIGQRKNLGIALGKRMYVQSLDIENNRVVLCDDDELFTKVVRAKDVCHMSEEHFDGEKVYTARIRYSQRPVECKIIEDESGICAEFFEGVRAPASGQALVIYDGDLVAGGGTIYVS